VTGRRRERTGRTRFAPGPLRTRCSPRLESRTRCGVGSAYPPRSTSRAIPLVQALERLEPHHRALARVAPTARQKPRRIRSSPMPNAAFGQRGQAKRGGRASSNRRCDGCLDTPPSGYRTRWAPRCREPSRCAAVCEQPGQRSICRTYRGLSPCPEECSHPALERIPDHSSAPSAVVQKSFSSKPPRSRVIPPLSGSSGPGLLVDPAATVGGVTNPMSTEKL